MNMNRLSWNILKDIKNEIILFFLKKKKKKIDFGLLLSVRRAILCIL